MRSGAVVRVLASAFILVTLLLGGQPCAAHAPARERGPLKIRLRRPVAMALADNGSWLFIANHRSGSIRVVDTSLLRTLFEVDVGRSLADIAVSPAGPLLFAVDEGANELILLSRQGPLLSLIQRLPLPPIPVSIQVVADGSRCFIASLWARQLSEIDLRTVPSRITRTISLPFAPREQLVVSESKLVVADAFGGRLAVVDMGRGQVDSVRSLPAHNIRGLALSQDGKELLVAHQALNGRAATTFDDVHWGNLLTNNLRVLPLHDVLKPDADLLRGSRLHYLGDVGKAAGDPARMAVARDGTMVVTLAGVGEVALGHEKEYRWQRLTVGQRPTAVVISPDGRWAYVGNQFADSVSVIDLSNQKVTANLSLGPMPVLTASDRGEMLFYDARLAHDGWMSCHSCHTDGHSNGQLADTLGDGSFGTPKRVLSLLGVRDTAPYAWNGSMPDLESQIRKSIVTTLHGANPTDQQVADLAAYLRTLPPAPSLAQATEQAGSGSNVSPRLEGAIRRGREVFHAQSCDHCHAPPQYTSKATYDVGLKDEVGNTRFNPPSLRGVSQAGPYFHDNRAVTLDEVVRRYRHQLPNGLPPQEAADLLAFLDSL